jgi:hypothetical protein
MVNLKITSADPFRVLESTRSVLEDARFVFIKEENIPILAGQIRNRFPQGVSLEQIGFRSTGDPEKDIQRIFIENNVNFCFWAGKGREKWKVEWPKGNLIDGGWYGLAACFDRALAENIPILDANYLASISDADVRNFFRSANNTEIPLIKERTNNLREAGRVLIEKFGGKAINIVEKGDYDAVKIIKLIIDNFSSFRDISILDERKIFFLKRAQLCPNDFNYILKQHGKEIKNLDVLTAFADYKIPQILRNEGILEYSPELAEKVDNFVEISRDSREEIEIRAATIWGTELLRQEIKNLSSREIDNAIWLISQDQKGIKPYHRTRTIFY